MGNRVYIRTNHKHKMLRDNQKIIRSIAIFGEG